MGVIVKSEYENHRFYFINNFVLFKNFHWYNFQFFQIHPSLQPKNSNLT